MDSVKIIFADDDIVTRKLVLKLMVNLDFQILVAENGNEAWELLNQSGARILITDWVMPVMTGIDLCRKVRENYSEAYIYIILVTGRGEKEDIIEGLKAGADDFLVKPINIGELTARVRSGLRVIKLEDDYKKTSAQLHQAEKMASVGQLAAGVAHEINNPTGFVNSNLKTLADYIGDISELADKYRDFISEIKHVSSDFTKTIDSGLLKPTVMGIENFEKKIDIEFLMTDVADLVRESRDGLERIKKIVSDLKDFAHPGEDTMQEADINECIDSTLNVIWNEVKYKAVVTKNYGDLPAVLCFPQQLNQVFMNIIVNAAQAIAGMGEIIITTDRDNDKVRIRIRDNGSGIEEKNQSRIFDPFFTTKEVGKGTGLGMNVAYNIIEKHKGSITLWSEVGTGTEFTIILPVK